MTACGEAAAEARAEAAIAADDEDQAHGSRSSTSGETSIMVRRAPLLEHRGLADQLAQPGMVEPKDEGEAAMTAVDMADPHPARRQPARQAEPQAGGAQEV